MNPTEQQAMAELAVQWTRVQPAVGAFIASLVPAHHDAEDLLQRTAAALVTKCDQYDPSQPFVAWAIGIAKIEVLRHRQKRQRERLIFDDQTISAVASAYVDLSPELGEMRDALDRCVRKLRGRSRQVLELHYVTELSTNQIADRLRITTSTVFATLHRAREALRQCMQRQLSVGGRGAS